MNWKQIIEDLLAAGLTRAEIVDRTGCHNSTLTELCGGQIQNPRFPVAQALIALHAKEVPQVGAGETTTQNEKATTGG